MPGCHWRSGLCLGTRSGPHMRRYRRWAAGYPGRHGGWAGPSSAVFGMMWGIFEVDSRRGNRADGPDTRRRRQVSQWRAGYPRERGGCKWAWFLEPTGNAVHRSSLLSVLGRGMESSRLSPCWSASARRFATSTTAYVPKWRMSSGCGGSCSLTGGGSRGIWGRALSLGVLWVQLIKALRL